MQPLTFSSLRRRAATKGYKLSKISRRSKWFVEYGPYLLTDPTASNGVVTSGSLDEVAAFITS